MVRCAARAQARAGPWKGADNRLIRRVDPKMVHPADDGGKRGA
jgi:hypothetical protein